MRLAKSFFPRACSAVRTSLALSERACGGSRWYDSQAHKVWSPECRPSWSELKRHCKGAKSKDARDAKLLRYNAQRRAARLQVRLRHEPFCS